MATVPGKRQARGPRWLAGHPCPGPSCPISCCSPHRVTLVKWASQEWLASLDPRYRSPLHTVPTGVPSIHLLVHLFMYSFNKYFLSRLWFCSSLLVLNYNSLLFLSKLIFAGKIKKKGGGTSSTWWRESMRNLQLTCLIVDDWMFPPEEQKRVRDICAYRFFIIVLTVLANVVKAKKNK